jgi:heme-degrading monooxygenase HmoA
MIARLWHGYTRPEDADTYEEMLRTTILPGIHRIAGYKGSYVLREKEGAEVEFITITLWESLEAIRQFAGPNYEMAVIVTEAKQLLTRHDEKSKHYTAFHVQ